MGRLNCTYFRKCGLLELLLYFGLQVDTGTHIVNLFQNHPQRYEKLICKIENKLVCQFIQWGFHIFEVQCI